MKIGEILGPWAAAIALIFLLVFLAVIGVEYLGSADYYDRNYKGGTGIETKGPPDPASWLESYRNLARGALGIAPQPARPASAPVRPSTHRIP